MNDFYYITRVRIKRKTEEDPAYFGRGVADLLHGIETVSYTHLDVYKRQGKSTGRFESGDREGEIYRYCGGIRIGKINSAPYAGRSGSAYFRENMDRGYGYFHLIGKTAFCFQKA